jgi:hypothetical protein
VLGRVSTAGTPVVAGSALLRPPRAGDRVRGAAVGDGYTQGRPASPIALGATLPIARGSAPPARQFIQADAVQLVLGGVTDRQLRFIATEDGRSW